MDEKDIKKIFTTNRVDVPDEGFSERITGQLPARKSMLYQIIMVVSIMLGLVLVFAIQGFNTVPEQIYNLIISISHSQMPSPSSMITYIIVLAMTGIIGYSMVYIIENQPDKK
jgi:hypothetical protein